MLKNVQYKSIFMGNGLRYIVSATIDGDKRGKILSINESKFIHALNTKEKYQYAEKMLYEESLNEYRDRQPIKLFDVIWVEGDIRHHQRIKSKDEKGVMERVHSRGGSVVTLQQVN
jgi:hypothetical protein